MHALPEDSPPFAAAFDASPVGLAQADPATAVLLRVNPRMAAMLGRRPEDMVGRSLLDFTHPDDREANWAGFQRLATGELSTFQIEQRMLHAEGRSLWVLMAVNLIRDEDGRPVGTSAALVDLSSRKLVEEALADSERRLRLALEAAKLGRWEWEPAASRLRADARCLSVVALPEDEERALASPAELFRWVHPADAGQVRACDAAGRAGEPFHAEFRLQPAGGTLRWVAVDACPEHGERGELRMVGVVADISLRRQAEEQLRERRELLEAEVAERTDRLQRANTALGNEVEQRRLAEAQVRELLGQLVGIEEEERRRVSRELHDAVGQHLTALTIGLQVLASQAALPSSLRPELARLQAVARHLDDDVERLSHRLRPTTLDDLGLEDALRQHIAEWSHDTGIEAGLLARGLKQRRWDAATETTVFRFVQEALTNVRRHAKASKVSVILDLHDDELRAIVEDNGNGFDGSPPQASGRGGLGLRGMAERAALAGGHMDLESSPGVGTTLYLTLPLHE